MEKFYKEQYEEIKKKNNDLTKYKENTMKIFTSFIVVTILPLLNMITPMKLFGYKLACYIVFAVLLLVTGITLLLTILLYIRNDMQTEVVDLAKINKKVRDTNTEFDKLLSEEQWSDDNIQYINGVRNETISNFLDRYYIELYDKNFESYNKRNSVLSWYFAVIVVNLIIEIALAILIIISKIFLL